MADEPVIALADVTFRYPGAERAVLEGTHLQIGAGERVFLHGPSGSGKSTLLGIVAGVQVATSGKVHVLGRDLTALSATARDQVRADHMGLIFQQFNLVPYLSVIENVVLPTRFSALRKQRADDPRPLLKALGIEELANRPVTQLSVGEQQRTAVARALLGKPEIVIADEPTSALDADSRDAFIEMLLAQANETGSAVLFVSHDRSLARHFTREVGIADLRAVTA